MAIPYDLIHCPICLELYEKPRALPCLHTFCEMCIQEYINTEARSWPISSGIECPVCRRHVAPPGKTDYKEWSKQFPLNHIIMTLLGRWSEQSEGSSASGKDAGTTCSGDDKERVSENINTLPHQALAEDEQFNPEKDNVVSDDTAADADDLDVISDDRLSDDDDEDDQDVAFDDTPAYDDDHNWSAPRSPGYGYSTDFHPHHGRVPPYIPPHRRQLNYPPPHHLPPHQFRPYFRPPFRRPPYQYGGLPHWQPPPPYHGQRNGEWGCRRPYHFGGPRGKHRQFRVPGYRQQQPWWHNP